MPLYATAENGAHSGRPIQIRRGNVNNCRCPQCGTNYDVVWHVPAQDNGSAECEVCGHELMRWRNAAIPSFRRLGRDWLAQMMDQHARE